MPTRLGKFLIWFIFLCEGVFDVLVTLVKGAVWLAVIAVTTYLVGFCVLFLYALIREEPWVLVVALLAACIYAAGRHLRQT